MLHILIIEDDATISGLVSDILHIDGFQVETAENGVLGLAKVRERPPDLIVVDLKMPVMNGWDFVRCYRMLPGCAERPVLVLAAAPPSEQDNFGVSEFLAKPFELKDFRQVVMRLSGLAEPA